MANRNFGILAIFLFFIEYSGAQCYWQMEAPEAQGRENVTKIFLDDTNYYVSRDYLFTDDSKYYMQYFLSTGALEYELKDGLPDGNYMLVALTRKKAEKLPVNIMNGYVVATGSYENGMKQGKFTFSTITPALNDNTEVEPEYKSIEFTNDTVNGNVQEYFGQALYHLAQYKMGKLDGYYITASSTVTLFKIYEDGILVKEFIIE